MQKEFEIFLTELKKENFEVKINYEEKLEKNFVRFEKNGVMGIAGENHNPRNNYAIGYLNGKIIAENKECFDKIRKCPLNIELPKNKKQAKQLIKEMEFLGTKEGYELSSEGEYPMIKKYEDLDKRIRKKELF